MALTYFIYTDESKQRGPYYSNFYGGALVRSVHFSAVVDAIQSKKDTLGFRGEVKWQKVTAQYLDRYIGLMNLFFDLVTQDKVKIRIMFTQNVNEPQNLSKEQRDNAYFLLYYQFIKHAFGLQYSNPSSEIVQCRLLLDRTPSTREKMAALRAHLAALSNSTKFRDSRIHIRADNIAEVDSHDHAVMQCLDIVLGAMQFRLNNRHLEKVPGTRHRGKKTRAKETLYRLISKRIRTIYPFFNIGISTGHRGDMANRWKDPYRHWLFVPKDHRKDFRRAKR